MIVTLVAIARNVEVNVKDLCRTCGGKFNNGCLQNIGQIILQLQMQKKVHNMWVWQAPTQERYCDFQAHSKDGR